MLNTLDISIDKAEEYLEFAEIPDCDALVGKAKSYLLERFADFDKEWHR